MLGVCGGCVNKGWHDPARASSRAPGPGNVVVDFFVCLSLKRGLVLICRRHERDQGPAQPTALKSVNRGTSTQEVPEEGRSVKNSIPKH